MAQRCKKLFANPALASLIGAESFARTVVTPAELAALHGEEKVVPHVAKRGDWILKYRNRTCVVSGGATVGAVGGAGGRNGRRGRMPQALLKGARA